MKRLFILFASLSISGCSGSSPAPYFLAGQYYLAGDKDCKSLNEDSPNRVVCYDKKGNLTGYRYAMTPQEMQFWLQQAAASSAQTQQLIGQMQQLGQSAQNWGQQFSQQSQQYTAPHVQGLGNAGTPNPTYFSKVGDQIIGSNGVTYRKVGNSILGSDGTVCQISGSQLICR